MTVAYLGIDVSKTSLHLGAATRFLRTFENSLQGHDRLIEYLAEHKAARIVLEASGGYERAVCDRLHDAGLKVTVAQPSCVRHFARSLKVLAKTDEIDACVIARFGEATQPEATSPTPQNTRRIRALCDRRQQVIEDRVREQNRLEACADSLIANEIFASIEALQATEERIDRQIDSLLQADEVMQHKADVMMQQKGVGQRTARAVLAWLPELGTLNRGQVAALAGLAPYADDSGTKHGKRRIYAGRAALRKALYMAAKTAARWCPVLSEFYNRLREAGKSYNTAIIACARKLIVRLNSLIKALDTETNSPIAANQT